MSRWTAFAPAKTGEFLTLPLAVEAQAATPAVADIRVELCRGATTMTIAWKASASRRLRCVDAWAAAVMGFMHAAGVSGAFSAKALSAPPKAVDSE
jgi:hypothetical protein